MKEFNLTTVFDGYRAKTDVTKIRETITNSDKSKLGIGSLVKGSQNVLSTDGENIKSREGYTLYGAANTALTPIESSYVWNTHLGVEIPLRSYDDELEYRYGGTWYKLADSWSAVDFNFAEYWDTTESSDALLFVNGDSNIYYWSGGITTFASATANTITKQGTTSWAESGFLTAGTRQVIINEITYTYTGGESTTTLTGVTPDPTAVAHTAGDIAVQAVRTTADTPAAGYNNDIIMAMENQIWVGDFQRRDIYVSAVNDYTDYTFASPRAIGEGALLTLDSTPVGFIVKGSEDSGGASSMYVAGSKNDWYKSDFVIADDVTSEALFIRRLKTSTGQGAQNQGGITHIKNMVATITKEPTLDTLGRIENIDTTQSHPLSDPIKSDFDSYDFTNCHAKYFKNNLYIALPVESRVLIYNIEKGYWEAPQILPVRRLEVIGNDLYGHSNAVPETYKLFDGSTDNGSPIKSVATFAYKNYGKRAWQKNFDEHYTEGYIGGNTKINLKLRYDFDGYGQITDYDIKGDDDAILFKPTDDGSLGKLSLGKGSLGGKLGDVDGEALAKFRQINTMLPENFYEIQEEYSSDGEDQRWELLAFGANAKISSADNNHLKQ